MKIDEREIWVEKYRPKKLEDLVLPERYKRDFQYMIERQEMDHLLFYGPPGGGKTTIGRILCSKNGIIHRPTDNVLFVNGSSKKHRSIQYVDEIIDRYLEHPPVNDKYKVVFIDEADNLSRDAFRSLRGLIEKFQKTYGRFLFTCNYPSEIPNPIRSRFTEYKFQQIPKEFVVKFLKGILDSEKIEYDDKSVLFIVDNLYPDVRKIVQVTKKNSLSNKLEVGEDAISTNENVIMTNILEIISFIEKGQYAKVGGCIDQIIAILSVDDVDYRRIYTTLFYDKKVPPHAKVIINKFASEHRDGFEPSMHFIAMLFAINNSLKQLREMYVNGSLNKKR